MAWREEEALCGVAQAELVASARHRAFLVDDRHDGPNDDVPIPVQLERYDGLDVERGTGTVAWPVAFVVIELEGHAYQAGDWIGQLFGQIGVALSARRVGY